MTERRRRPHAAAGARILSAGVSASLMIGIVGNLVAHERRTAAAPVAATEVALAPLPAVTAAPTTVAPSTAPPTTQAPRRTVTPPPAPRVVTPAAPQTRSHGS